MVYRAHIVADYILLNAGVSLTAAKLIKLTYIAHGYCLRNIQPLLTSEIRAWENGPMILELDHVFGKRGAYVNNLITNGRPLNEDMEDERRALNLGLHEHSKLALDKVIRKFAHASDHDLRIETSGRNTPWDICNMNGTNMLITDQMLRDYYTIKLMPYISDSRRREYFDQYRDQYLNHRTIQNSQHSPLFRTRITAKRKMGRIFTMPLSIFRTLRRRRRTSSSSFSTRSLLILA